MTPLCSLVHDRLQESFLLLKKKVLKGDHLVEIQSDFGLRTAIGLELHPVPWQEATRSITTPPSMSNIDWWLYYLNKTTNLEKLTRSNDTLRHLCYKSHLPPFFGWSNVVFSKAPFLGIGRVGSICLRSEGTCNNYHTGLRPNLQRNSFHFGFALPRSVIGWKKKNFAALF